MRGKFKNQLFRASQAGILMTGTIGLTEKQKVRMRELRLERDQGINANGNKVKWTPTKHAELEDLVKKDNNELPQTIKTNARKLHRAETHNRVFNFTNKFVQKGINEEDESITTYSRYCAEILGTPKFFLKNDVRLNNEYFTGEPDLVDSNDVLKCEEGIDIKSSWELETLPFKDDVLKPDYFAQNQVYMNLTGARRWSTVFVLVNAPADLVQREKMRFHVAWGSPNPPNEGEESSYAWKQYLKQAREIEKRLIFDRARFEETYPFFDWDISKEEWEEGGYDIPLKDRVVEFPMEYDPKYIENLELRARLTRKYMNSL